MTTLTSVLADPDDDLVVVGARGERRLAGAVRARLGRERAARAQADEQHERADQQQRQRPPVERVLRR